MAEKYKYNPRTLSYEKMEGSIKSKILKVSSVLVSGLVFAAVTVIVTYSYIDSPKERRLKRENQQLTLQYEFLNKRLEQMESVLKDIQHRDDNIYRVVFEADPIPSNIREAGVGGVNRYKGLDGFDNSQLVISTTKNLDKLAKQLYIQSKSFDDVVAMAKQKEKMLASIPAIQPVSNKDLTRMASGYGYRIHPIYKARMMHHGMDFTAPTGTEIYATGNGRIVKVKRSRRGLGNHVVIDHGYGYKTTYGHMSSFKVRRGQNIKRGDVIGFVGSTGTSTAPHLHYEVHKNGRKINPVNFYFNDLSPEEFDKMIQISSTNNQSFD